MLWLGVALASCSSRHAERPDPAPSADAAAAVDRRDGGSHDSGSADCQVPRRAPRTFVGFSENMSLDDFELAATAAERILAMLEAELCALSPEQDPEGSLRAALAAGVQVQITSVELTLDDATAADVTVRIEPDPDAGTAQPLSTWTLQVVYDGQSWQIHSVMPEAEWQ
jgi:hypothetical protein